MQIKTLEGLKPVAEELSRRCGWVMDDDNVARIDEIASAIANWAWTIRAKKATAIRRRLNSAGYDGPAGH